jgi:hypothetical protein
MLLMTPARVVVVKAVVVADWPDWRPPGLGSCN